ncbi:MAG: hypothetical protein LBC96_04260 [Lachnospiraceae bacterium]|nr:hypothetical protein [Lachnospiraceae bacterium]
MFGFNKKKKIKEETPEEKFFRENYDDLFLPPSAFDGYEIADDSKEKLTAIFDILTNGLADKEEISFESRYEFVDSLVSINFLTSDFEQQYTLTEIVSELNGVARNLNYKIELSEEDVMQIDDDIKKQAREYFTYITHHDLNVCSKLLEQQGYELFQVFLDCGGLTMSILPKERIEDLKKYTK